MTAATTSTVGTKRAVTLSTSRSIGAREPCASSTIRTIPDRTVSRPTFSALKSTLPVPLMVPANTLSPVAFSTGMLTPVSVDSSTEETPSTTEPSTAMRSPGRTEITSPGSTSSTGISTRSSPRTRSAVRGWRPMSLRMAPDVRLLARPSRNLPSRMSPMIAADTSKYVPVA